MPDRQILLGLMTYRKDDEDKNWAYGFQGDTVSVHPDYVDTFDELNVDPGPPFDPLKQSVEVMAGAGAKSVDPPENMTVAELKDELDGAEIEYPSDARKDDLVKLVKKAR